MKKRGVGLANMWYGIGNTGLPNPASAYIELLDDGTVIVLTGCADIGQGSTTTLAQIAAEEMGVDIEDVRVVSADTGITPDAGATSASRQTYISGNAVKMAAKEAKTILVETAARMLEVDEDSLILEDRKIVVKNDKDKFVKIKECLGKCRAEGKLTLGHGWFNPDVTALNPEDGQGKPYATYAFATQVAEVEVNTETGEVKVLKIFAAHDVGKAINPINVEGQIEGGCMIGVGFALMEQVKVDKGNIKTPNLATYLIPTAMDTPEIYPIIVEDPEVTGPFGAKGVGEPALIPTAAAIVNAIYDAVGVRITDLPVTPEKLLKEIKKERN